MGKWINAALSASNLVIGYKGKPLAEPLDFTLREGELVCLIGPNGAGKSTLLRTLAGMQRPLHGIVHMGSAIPYAISPTERARLLSVVLTARPDALLLTGYALVALGRHPYTDWRGQMTPDDAAAVETAIMAVGAAEYAHRPLNTLSDGQAQKLMIARALAQDAPFMLLDEPTAYLDLPRRVEIVQLLRRIAHEQRRAVLLTTHDLDLALRTADRLLLLADGHLHTGAPEDLILSGAFERAFHAQGVAFDSASGSFCFGDPAVQPIALVGEGQVRRWTQRALERAGCSVQESAAQRIVIAQTSAGTRWQLWRGERCEEYETIHALVEALRHQPTPAANSSFEK
jgi:iron complex transport system ATP-binding protein